MPRIVPKRLHKLNLNERRQLWGLTLGRWGQMHKELVYDLGYQNPNIAYMLKDDDGRILAWALVMLPGESWTNDYENNLNIYLFTRKSERRKGYATRLLRHAYKKHGLLRVHPHDTVSNKFFNQFDLKTDLKTERKFLRNGSRKKSIRVQQGSRASEANQQRVS